jgi:hypothetical protein
MPMFFIALIGFASRILRPAVYSIRQIDEIVVAGNASPNEGGACIRGRGSAN